MGHEATPASCARGYNVRRQYRRLRLTPCALFFLFSLLFLLCIKHYLGRSCAARRVQPFKRLRETATHRLAIAAVKSVPSVRPVFFRVKSSGSYRFSWHSFRTTRQKDVSPLYPIGYVASSRVFRHVTRISARRCTM